MIYSNWGGIIERAVRAENKPAVYIANNLNINSKDNSVWDYVFSQFDEEVGMNLIHGGLFFFDDSEEAEDFYRIFNSGPAYASGIYAVLHDAAGRVLSENT